MRRRFSGGFGVAVVAALGLGLAASPALAVATASPMDICRDLADGQLNGTYTQGELAAYQNALAHDPTIQGYCSPLVVVTTPSTTTTTTTAATNGVAGTTTNKQSPKPGQVAPAQVVKTTPPASQSTASPLETTKSSGTLPFTGAELGVFAIVGAALLAGGLLLRMSARNRKSEL
jgi:uncharacterized surface anchored protein